jgi:pimeloyl-ACP methyl ester carboxylesterase
VNRPLLISIHGIRSKGRWQEEIEPLVEPFYQHFPFKYSEYSHPIFAVIWLGLEPLAIVLGALAATLWFSIVWPPSVKQSATIIASFIVFWLVARVLASDRRRRVLEAFKLHWSEKVGFDRPPHIIAHSFGTFLVGAALSKYTDLRVERLILTGCVLKGDYPWASFARSKNSRRFKAIHNEMAKRDWVAISAQLLQGFVPPMGHAGVFGFTDSRISRNWDDARLVDGQWHSDSQCGYKKQTDHFMVHNIAHKGLGHSDYFIGMSHARTFWLPFLWEIPAGLYEQFRDLCIECKGLESAARYLELSDKEALLTSSCWWWTGGPLESRVKQVVTKSLERRNADSTQTDHLVALSIRNLWELTWRAASHSKDPRFAVYLHPYTALTHAVQTAIDQSQAKTFTVQGR